MMAATIVGCTGLATQAQPLELPLLLPTWEHLFTLRAGGGFKDNLTLAHSATESSPFVSSGAEAIIARRSEEGTQLSFFLNADDRRYLSSEKVDKEQLAFGQAQLKKVFEDAGEASLTAEYIYQDQILDVSVTETNLQAVRVRGHTLAGRPGVRLNLSPRYWLSLEPAVRRQFLAAPLDDYTEFGVRVTLGRDYGYKSELSLKYEPSYRNYDTDPQISATGATIPNTRRIFTQHDVRLNWRHHWDQERHWRTTTRLSYKINNDNGPGYFDYTKISASEQVRYRTKGWEFSAEAKVSRYYYGVQTARVTDPAKRERTEVTLNFRAERQLAKSLRLVAAYDYERTLSNVRLETYTANTVSGSLQWEF